MESSIKTYYSLTKPTMVYGNLITTTAGFLLASRFFHSSQLNIPLLLGVLIGFSLVIASGCVFNNYIDQGVDAVMARTKNRALVHRLIPGRHAIIFGTTLGVLGFFILTLCTNWLTVIVSFAGFFFYVVMYSIWKRRSVHGTLVGSISGAVPPLVGYVAASNNFDLGAIILFTIFFLWQLPHFYAIAIYRMSDYAAASIPVMPIKKGIPTTKIYILGYIAAFVIAATLPTVFGYAGYVYLITSTTLGIFWLGLSIWGFWTHDDRRWARGMFFFSLIMLISLCVVIAVDMMMSVIR